MSWRRLFQFDLKENCSMPSDWCFFEPTCQLDTMPFPTQQKWLARSKSHSKLVSPPKRWDNASLIWPCPILLSSFVCLSFKNVFQVSNICIIFLIVCRSYITVGSHTIKRKHVHIMCAYLMHEITNITIFLSLCCVTAMYKLHQDMTVIISIVTNA